MSATALNHRWLYMEQTAYTSSERLPDMNSQNGDSFLDELCTMSCTVQQVVEGLELCMEVGGSVGGWVGGLVGGGVGRRGW